MMHGQKNTKLVIASMLDVMILIGLRQVLF